MEQNKLWPLACSDRSRTAGAGVGDIWPLQTLHTGLPKTRSEGIAMSFYYKLPEKCQIYLYHIDFFFFFPSKFTLFY